MLRFWRRVTGLNEVVFSTLLCNAIEHYDFVVYGIMSPVINKVFFSQDIFFPQEGNTYLSSLVGFLVFASAFIARPAGSVLFGYVGDKMGRKVSLNASTGILLASVLGIALLPTPSVLGFFSVVLLTSLRVIQGLAYGAEVGGVTLMVESVDKEKVKIVWVARIIFSVTGLVIGTGLVKVCEVLFTEDQMCDWGWRVPFLVAFLAGLPLPYLRRLIHESKEYVEYKSSGRDESILKSLAQNIGSVLLIFSMAALSSGFFYLSVVYLDIGHRAGFVEYAFSMGLLILCASANLFISDFGKRKGYFVASLLLISILAYPTIHYLYEGYALARITLLVLSGIYLGWYGSFVALMFPVGARQTCFSVSYSSGYVIGALSPAICLWFNHVTGLNNAPAMYLIFFSTLIAFSVALCVRVENGNYRIVFRRKRSIDALVS